MKNHQRDLVLRKVATASKAIRAACAYLASIPAFELLVLTGCRRSAVFIRYQDPKYLQSRTVA